jgi:hypothetical protein
MPSLEDVQNMAPDARDELALLAKELAEDPATREQFLRLTKQKRQNLTIDAIDLKDEFRAEFAKIRGENEALQAKLRERDALEELERRRQALVKKGRAKSDDDVAEIEKVMLEKGITNHETAAEYHDFMKRAATPTKIQAFDRSFMNEQARDTLAKFRFNPQQAARDEASKALNELRKNSGSMGF